MAEEIVREVALRALRGVHPMPRSEGRPWLLRIVRSDVHAALQNRWNERTQSSDHKHSGNDPEQNVRSPDTVSMASASQAPDPPSLADALAALPIELRECLILHQLEELSYHDIGRITCLPTATVMSRLLQARQALLRGLVLTQGTDP